jgi:hypothetical protein
MDDDLERLERALRRYPPEDRRAWTDELKRLAEIVGSYLSIDPKRRRTKPGGGFEYVPAVMILCQQAICTDPLIVRREPHRRRPPSPHTLDRWSRAYQKEGLVAFLREETGDELDRGDHRLACISREAIEWVQEHWRDYHSPHRLYRDWKREADRRQWKIPGESWLYRRWREMPAIVKTVRESGWNGKVIDVHRNAMKPTGDLELVLMQRQVGILKELQIQHLYARGYNAKEKPVERLHRTISEWEKNTFAEYCGSKPSQKPERLIGLMAEQQAYERGRRSHSPFISWEEYKAKLADFIDQFNRTPHQRTNLADGLTLTPLTEYQRLCRVRYEIKPETVSVLLMKVTDRVLSKIGVRCFQQNWYYWCEAMSRFKDSEESIKVEVRFTDRDYSRVWVVLPDEKTYEARLVQRSPLLNPNRETLQTVSKARANERKLIRDFELLAQSMWREESTEDRVSRLMAEQLATETKPVELEQTRVYRLTRLEQIRSKEAAAANEQFK